MAEEGSEKKGAKILKTVLKVIVGLLFVAGGIYLVMRWNAALLIVFKGCIGLFLFMVGIITIAIAKE